MLRKLMYRLLPLAFVFALVLCLLTGTVTAAVLSGPTPYLSFAADSPFAGGLFSYFHNEDFEDGVLSINTPGLSISAGAVVRFEQVGAAFGFVDSVAEDNPLAGNFGGSIGVSDKLVAFPVVISFNQAVLGSLPTHAGLVVTDLQLAVSPFDFTHDVTVDFFGPGNVLLGSVTDPAFGTSGTVGQTGEDRGFFAIDAGGIERIEVRSTRPVDLEFDHIQYGLLEGSDVIPEPTTLVIWSLLATLGLSFYRRRRRRAF